MNLMLSVMMLVTSGLGDVIRHTESAENLEETDQNVFDNEPNIDNKNSFSLKPVDTNRILEAFYLWRTLIKTVMEVKKVLEDRLRLFPFLIYLKESFTIFSTNPFYPVCKHTKTK